MKTPISWALLLALAAPLRAQTPQAAKGAPPVNPDPQTPTVTGAANGAALPVGALERLLASRPVVNDALTLDAAVAIALRESPAIRGAAEEVEAALGRLNAARAERRPILTANTFLTGGSIGNIIESPQVAMGSALMNAPRGAFFDQNLTLMAPLYTGGRLKTLVRQATALREASQAELESRRQEVALLTRTAYREVLARRALVAVQRARLRENQEQLRLDRVRAQQGKIPPFFVLRQEAEVAATQQELTDAARDVELSLLQLQTVMGINPASALDVTGSLDYQPSAAFIVRLSGVAPRPATPNVAAPDAGSSAPSPNNPASPAPRLSAELSALLRAAERGRPELRAAGQRISGAELETSAISGSYRPQVNAFVMGDVMKMRGESLSGGTTFGLAASIPLFTGGRRSAALQSAQAERRRLERERERIALEVAQSVQSAYLNLRAAEQNIGTAQTASRAAQEDLRVARIRYESGRGVLVEVLDALAARTRAQSNIVQALFSYNVARDQLLRAVGELAPTAS